MTPPRQTTASDISPQDISWPFWPIVPLYPYGQRRTLRKEVVKDTIWTFEQCQGILYVVVPIRMTVVKLATGGLLVYAPVAPTGECIRLVNELVDTHGEVKYIILPTVSGIEHKVFVGPFARCFPKAQVFISPDQWSFPVNLPLSWLGFPRKRTQKLPLDSHESPFFDEFDYEILGPLDLGLGPFQEVAFYHKRSQTLLLTDSIISVPAEPPEITQLDPYPLLFHAKNNSLEMIEDTPEKRIKGWQRTVLFALYFRPNALGTVEWSKVFKDALKAPDRSKKAYFGLFPFEWDDSWTSSFEKLHHTQLLVAPILQGVIFNRSPLDVLIWVDRVTKWGFNRIIPAHFSAPIISKPSQFREAFDCLRHPNHNAGNDDFQLIQNIAQSLTKFGVTPPSQL
ncbi:DUF4336 domain-containing protein [Crocosphaera sp.]|uniref:DUF4336 domain-containing protein n=1 Tax=Crocosphaera sp. TaxID=2729996 RepID=UPI002637BDDF|nr:DUF4336 domain-containing protein [Crocosphaera sp.]MDJ0583408.1 DUF4336 domain-containing protein [Crocosphaera sp.]